MREGEAKSTYCNREIADVDVGRGPGQADNVHDAAVTLASLM